MASFKFDSIYLNDFYTMVGQKESEGKIKNADKIVSNYMGEKTFELAEIKMQQEVIDTLLNRNKNIDFLVGGDLLNQIAITSYSARNYKIPLVGLYSACSTFTEALLISCLLIEKDRKLKVLSLTSSHNQTAERQFRFPIEYGNNRPSSATVTLTASAGAVISAKKSDYQLTGGTFGSVVDMGISDTNNMGAVMAPACAQTLYKHLKTFNLTEDYYDVILTGDLGKVGVEILKEYYEKVYKKKLKNLQDAGSSIFKDDQNCYSGGSGPVCLPLVLFTKILKNKKYKKILLLGTGSLHTPVLVNQKQSIPAVSHAVALEIK